jgi:hypothetical protein
MVHLNTAFAAVQIHTTTSELEGHLLSRLFFAIAGTSTGLSWLVPKKV